MKKHLSLMVLIVLICVGILGAPCVAIATMSKVVDIPHNLIPEAVAIEVATSAFDSFECTHATPHVLEVKAVLVYDDVVDTNLWVISHIVKNEAEPYFVSTINASSGELISISKMNYLELYDLWEAERNSPYLFWEMSDLVLFDELYRRSELYPRYILPTAKDIGMDDAKQIAQDTLKNKFGISEHTLRLYMCSATLRLDVDNTRKWYVYYCTIESPTQARVKYQVTLDAQSGSVIQYIKN